MYLALAFGHSEFGSAGCGSLFAPATANDKAQNQITELNGLDIQASESELSFGF